MTFNGVALAAQAKRKAGRFAQPSVNDGGHVPWSSIVSPVGTPAVRGLLPGCSRDQGVD